VPKWPESDRLAREKEVLGFFISGHPLEKYRDELALFADVNTANLAEHRDRKVELACVVTAMARQISKRNGQEWGRVTVEDFRGTATVLAFGEAWEKYREVLVQDAAVLVRGQVSGRDRDEDDPPIFLDEALPLALIRAPGPWAWRSGCPAARARSGSRPRRRRSGAAPATRRSSCSWRRTAAMGGAAAGAGGRPVPVPVAEGWRRRRS
jgi:hypothetical protein